MAFIFLVRAGFHLRKDQGETGGNMISTEDTVTFIVCSNVFLRNEARILFFYLADGNMKRKRVNFLIFDGEHAGEKP